MQLIQNRLIKTNGVNLETVGHVEPGDASLISKLTAIQETLEASNLQTGLLQVRSLLNEYQATKYSTTAGNSTDLKLKIFTMGRFSVIHENEPIVFRSKAQKRPLDLLKAIIALGSRGVSKSHLTELLWPDSSGDAAVSVINTTLSRLRKLIGKDAILTEDGCISLNRNYCSVDCWELERLLNSGKNPMVFTDETVVAILKIYQGDFMAGQQEGWLIPKRDKLKNKLTFTLSSYGNWLMHRKNLQQACTIYETCIDLDRTHEDFYINLMQCQILQNKTNAAKKTYRQCEKNLMNDLGVLPTASYVQICETQINA